MFHVFRSTNVTMYALWVKINKFNHSHHPISGFSNKTRFQNKLQTGIVFKKLSWSISKYSYFSGCFQFSVCRLGVQDVECLKKSPITSRPKVASSPPAMCEVSYQLCSGKLPPPPLYRKKFDSQM